RIHGGERISAIGWMAGIDGPANPGERDYKTQMRRRGIVGRMTLRNPGNCRIFDRAPPRGRWHSLRAFLNHAASTVLQRGLDRELEDRQRLAFLDAILLGRNSGDLR